MHERTLNHTQETGNPTAAVSELPRSCSPVCELTLSRHEMELRRMEAADQMLNGLRQSEVPIKFGVTRTTASRWHRALSTKGLESLRERKATGRPSRLTIEQKMQIADLLKQDASDLGFSGSRWTATSLAKVIEARFGVRYSLDHVGRFMCKLGPHIHTTIVPGLKRVDTGTV